MLNTNVVQLIHLGGMLSLLGTAAISSLLNVEAWAIVLSSRGPFALLASFFAWIVFQTLELEPLLCRERSMTTLDKVELEIFRSIAYGVKLFVLIESRTIYNPDSMKLLVPGLLALFGVELSLRGFLTAKRRYKDSGY